MSGFSKSIFWAGAILGNFLLAQQTWAESNQEPTERELTLFEFQLPANALAKTLVEFAVQAQVAVVVPYELVEPYRSSSVIGTMRAVDALDKLLKRTPFSYRIDYGSSPQITIIPKLPKTKEPDPVESIVNLDPSVDEVIVTGIRASLAHAVDIKRDAYGIVDAITAEDMGKFPDTNLAESIQRIPGASISRVNGEGSKITVRGFTGNYNAVTFNGRVMPVIAAPVERVEDSRAFEFSTLAAESIRRVEIFKTGRADIPAGGIGATVNIVSYQPFDQTGRNNFIAVKGVHDDSALKGRSITPEVSGLFRWHDDKWGISFAGAVQERDSRTAKAYVSQWKTGRWVNPGAAGALVTHSASCEQTGGNPQSDACYRIVNAPAVGQLYSVPADLHYALSDVTRERTNGHLIAQFKPLNNITATLDYALFKNTTEQSSAETLLRLTQYRSYLEFDDLSVKTPVLTTETLFDNQGNPSGSDLGFSAILQEQQNKTDLLGLNIEFKVTDDFILHLDAHTSNSTSGPGDSAYGGWANVRFGANVVGAQQVDWRGDLPQFAISVNDNVLAAHNANDGIFNASDIGTQVAFSNYSFQRNQVEQLRLDGDWAWSAGLVEFGVDTRKTTNTTRFSDATFIMGDWGIDDPSIVPDHFFTSVNYGDSFPDYSTDAFYPNEYTANPKTLLNWAEQTYTQSFAEGFEYSKDFSVDRTTIEDQWAVYLQTHFSFDFNIGSFTAQAGLRYVSTDVEAGALVNEPSEIIWLDNGDFKALFNSGKTPISESNHYENLLPNIDFQASLKDSLVGRFSYSQSIARAEYAQLSPEISNIEVRGVTTADANNAFALTGNPHLEPLKSNNIDVSVEWYFNDTNYVSVGVYSKTINNFIGTETIVGPVSPLRDASAGPRAERARAEIAAQPGFDGTITETELFNHIAATENNDFNPVGTDNTYYGNTYDIYAQEEDPYFQIAKLTPVNNRKAKIWGAEYAGQYFFGESGFGLLANYTSVAGDVGFTIDADPNSPQFALLGLSDTMNWVAIYEKSGFQARLAYNWRARFLESLADEPKFVEASHQFDFMMSYQWMKNLTVSLEGINITGENSRTHGRTPAQLVLLEQLEARYQIGLRYRF